MNLDCSQLQEMILSLPLANECDRGRSGALRLSTPFRYPNGEKVDVFLDTSAELYQDLYLSDCGQTALYLRNAQVALDSTAKRRELVSDILSSDRAISLKGNRLIMRPDTQGTDSISNAILRLSQMCVRLSDLATHQRMRSTNAFRDDVEEFFEVQGLQYQSDVMFPPVFGSREIRVDFQVSSGNKVSYVNILAAMNDAAAHASANEIVVKLGDLQRAEHFVGHRFVTVYNSASGAIRIEDVERLQTLSNAVSYPEETDTLLAILVGDGTENRARVEL